MPHDHHDHDHISPSGHPYRADQDTALTYWQTMEIAMRELLVEKGVTTHAEINAQIDAMDKRSPADGARVVARAWTDPKFKEALLKDGRRAVIDMGFELGPMNLIVVENTADIHNVIVCTLCSCYPRNLLGLPPDWYKQRAYRARVVKGEKGGLAILLCNFSVFHHGYSRQRPDDPPWVSPGGLGAIYEPVFLDRPCAVAKASIADQNQPSGPAIDPFCMPFWRHLLFLHVDQISGTGRSHCHF